MIVFLRVNPSKIRELYEEKLEIEEYYKYHYDNFIIHLVTSIDLCGKLGNVLYDLKTPEKRANWHSFAFHNAIQNTEPSRLLLEFSDFLEDFRSQRHLRVHKGKKSANRFDKIVFWDDISKMLDEPLDDPDYTLLNDYTKKQIIEAADEIEKIIFETANYIVKFFDSLTCQLKKLIAKQ